MIKTSDEFALELAYILQQPDMSKTASVDDEIAVEQDNTEEDSENIAFAQNAIKVLHKIAEDMDQNEDFEASSLVDDALRVIVNKLSK